MCAKFPQKRKNARSCALFRIMRALCVYYAGLSALNEKGGGNLFDGLPVAVAAAPGCGTYRDSYFHSLPCLVFGLYSVNNAPRPLLRCRLSDGGGLDRYYTAIRQIDPGQLLKNRKIEYNELFFKLHEQGFYPGGLAIVVQCGPKHSFAPLPVYFQRDLDQRPSVRILAAGGDGCLCAFALRLLMVGGGGKILIFNDLSLPNIANSPPAFRWEITRSRWAVIRFLSCFRFSAGVMNRRRPVAAAGVATGAAAWLPVVFAVWVVPVVWAAAPNAPASRPALTWPPWLLD